MGEGLRPAVLVFSPPRPTGIVQLFGLALGLHLGLCDPCPTLRQFLPRGPGIWITAGGGDPPAFISIILKFAADIHAVTAKPLTNINFGLWGEFLFCRTFVRNWH